MTYIYIYSNYIYNLSLWLDDRPQCVWSSDHWIPVAFIGARLCGLVDATMTFNYEPWGSSKDWRYSDCIQ